jgi:hypothetical protein
MVPWLERPTLEIDLGTPMSRRFDGVRPEVFVLGRRLLDAVIREIPAIARMAADWARARTTDRFHPEAVGLAEHVDAPWRDVMLANLSYDLVVASLGCSTVTLPTPSGPVVARNMDWWPEDILAQASYLIRYSHHGAFRYANAGWPGAIGVVTGLSARGFAIILNAVTSSEGVCKSGYPVLLHLRRVLEDAQHFEEAVEMLTEEQLTASALLTLVGNRNEQRVVIERTPTRYAHRWPDGDEPLVATNDYRALFGPQTHDGSVIYQTTCARYDALCRFFTKHRADQELDDAALLYILSDRSVIQSITAQHIIMRPRMGTTRLFVPRRLTGA